jgi:hypothetical protein
MNTTRLIRPVALACALIVILPAALTFGDPEPRSESTIVIVQDDGHEVVIDMVAVNEIVSEAMEGMTEVMAEMEDMQFQMHIGQDNRLNLSYDETTFELDLDQIMAQVGVALEAGFAGIDTDDWTSSEDRWDSADEDELRRELDKLKAEMKELRKEIKKVNDQ